MFGLIHSEPLFFSFIYICGVCQFFFPPNSWKYDVFYEMKTQKMLIDACDTWISFCDRVLHTYKSNPPNTWIKCVSLSHHVCFCNWNQFRMGSAAFFRCGFFFFKGFTRGFCTEDLLKKDINFIKCNVHFTIWISWWTEQKKKRNTIHLPRSDANLF